MCPSLSTMAKVCLTIQVGTASEERSFLQMKSRLRNCLGKANLSHLMKIAIESLQTLSDKKSNK